MKHRFEAMLLIILLAIALVQLVVYIHEWEHAITCEKYGYEVLEFHPWIWEWENGTGYMVCDIQPDINTSKFLNETNEQIIWR